jgi:WD40 repeat protein
MFTVEPRGRVLVWEPATGCRIAALEGHEFPVEAVAFTPDGRLISADQGGALWV